MKTQEEIEQRLSILKQEITDMEIRLFGCQHFGEHPRYLDHIRSLMSAVGELEYILEINQ